MGFVLSIIGYFNKQPIKIKLMFVIMLTSISSLILTGVTVILYEHYQLKQYLLRDISALSILIADKSAPALANQDYRLAEKNLSTLLIKPPIVAARILNEKGDEFFKYSAKDNMTITFPTGTKRNGYSFENNLLLFFQPIIFDGKQIGTVFICASLKDIYTQQQYVIFLVGMMILFSSFFAFLLSSWFQLFISKPILYLTETAQIIASQDDYSLRAVKSSDDEIGILVNSFNHMLDTIDWQNKDKKILINELRESKSNLNTILDTIPLSIYWKDKNSNYIGCNKTFSDFAGLDNPDLIIGKTDFDLPWKQQADKFRTDDRKVISSGIANYHIQEPLLTADGKEIWVDITKIPLLGPNAKINAIIGVMEDITESKQAEENLRNSEARYRFLFEQNPLPMLIYEIDSLMILSVNDAFIAHYGYTEEEILSLHVADLYPEEEKLAIADLTKKIFGLVYVGEWHHLKKDGTQIIVEVHSHGFLFEGHSARIVVINDITERRRVEREIQTLNSSLEDNVVNRTEQLQEANKELEAFSYSVSHDLRAPLRHTSGYVDLLIRRCADDLSEKGKHYLSSIAESVHQMGMLIDDLLQFSRTGRAEVHKKNTDINNLVSEVLENIRHDNPNQSIEWIIADLPHVFCDRAMLKLVLINLLSNAVKFTRTRKLAIIEVGFRDESDEFLFFVRDNGVGFDMQYSHKLFGVFQRLHSTEEFEGTGIGLANVRRIISRHNGHTWAEAELDKGALFYFTLPKNNEEKL